MALPTYQQIQKWDTQRLLHVKKLIDEGNFLAFKDELIPDEDGYTEADIYILNVFNEVENRTSIKTNINPNDLISMF